MRLSTTRQCVTIEEYNCTAECGDTGGQLVPDIGRLFCNCYIKFEVILVLSS